MHLSQRDTETRRDRCGLHLGSGRQEARRKAGVTPKIKKEQACLDFTSCLKRSLYYWLADFVGYFTARGISDEEQVGWRKGRHGEEVTSKGEINVSLNATEKYLHWSFPRFSTPRRTSANIYTQYTYACSQAAGNDMNNIPPSTNLACQTAVTLASIIAQFAAPVNVVVTRYSTNAPINTTHAAYMYRTSCSGVLRVPWADDSGADE